MAKRKARRKWIFAAVLAIAIVAWIGLEPVFIGAAGLTAILGAWISWSTWNEGRVLGSLELHARMPDGTAYKLEYWRLDWLARERRVFAIAMTLAMALPLVWVVDGWAWALGDLVAAIVALVVSVDFEERAAKGLDWAKKLRVPKTMPGRGGFVLVDDEQESKENA